MSGPRSSKVRFQKVFLMISMHSFINISDPVKRNHFKQFVNTDKRQPQAEIIKERGQERPADWAKTYPPLKMTANQFTTPKAEWAWIALATKVDMMPSDTATTSVVAKYGDTQLAIFHV